MKHTNPLEGKMNFDAKGNLYLEEGIKFGGEMNPKVSPREWFYLLFQGVKYKDSVPKTWIKSTLGSSVTQWRIKKKLIAKGYLQ